MPRYFFEIAYHGAGYAGWQSQANATGVQTVVEHALSKLLRTEIKIVGSGRTDTGVHCAQQFFHTDIDKPFHQQNLLHRLNAFLPRDIAIRSIRTVKPKASARYSAVERTYQYHITRVKDPLQMGLALHYFKPLNIQTMNKAAALLRGEHDFECFSKVKTDVNHFLCSVKRADWKKESNELVFTITANRFLRGMVRAIVGTLLDVGTGKISMQEFRSILHSKDRRKAGANVDPHGLYLMQVKYPKSIFID
ncbi:MAG: tRNA pseudouridine(38-40) synthase TruA [Cyclobacteriaceae bacterium]|nr:tRNA pseudouridine(38-40) synthase TruA [Cyclobacteriaceae bacterium]